LIAHGGGNVSESNQVTCIRCGLEGPKLAKAPISGELGRVIFEQICQNCWNEWRVQSVNIVNHYGLQPADPNDRAQIYEFMKEFLTLPV
jgi:Fe-S cluster biosynthesis and repair protein YggX